MSSPPNQAQRLEARLRPAGMPVMYQQWRELLFLHWEYPADTIQKALPKGLRVDTYEGKAYLGIVPFFMQQVRPRFVPPVPGISNFMEMNVRTYVYDEKGIPGVWFFSLDANQRLAVAIARRFFHLPYEHARMKSSITTTGAIRYEWTRLNDKANGSPYVYEYAQGATLPEPAPDSLEFFLVERYRLFASTGGRLKRGGVFHPPYPLCESKVTSSSEHPMKLNGFPPTCREPDHIIMSKGVDVTVFPLEQI